MAQNIPPPPVFPSVLSQAQPSHQCLPPLRLKMSKDAEEKIHTESILNLLPTLSSNCLLHLPAFAYGRARDRGTLGGAAIGQCGQEECRVGGMEDDTTRRTFYS